MEKNKKLQKQTPAIMKLSFKTESTSQIWGKKDELQPTVLRQLANLGENKVKLNPPQAPYTIIKTVKVKDKTHY